VEWTGFVWLKIVISGRFLKTRGKKAVRFHKMLGMIGTSFTKFLEQLTRKSNTVQQLSKII
jgi:hypothetical protein